MERIQQRYLSPLENVWDTCCTFIIICYIRFFQILFKNLSFQLSIFWQRVFPGSNFSGHFSQEAFFPDFFEDIFPDIVLLNTSDDCFWMNLSSFLLVFTNAFVDVGFLLELMIFLSITFFAPLLNTFNTVRKPY